MISTALILSALELGCIYALVALALFLSYKTLNIADMTNKSKGEFAYTLIDLESAASAKALDELKEIEGMYRVRVVK